MSTRTSLRPNPVIVDGDMSDDITSDPTVLNGLTRVSYDFSWTGSTPVGTMAAQVSNSYTIEPDGSPGAPGDWTTIPIMLSDGSVALSAPVTGNSGTGFFDIQTGAYAVRCVFTSTSGTGTLQAIVAGKVS